MSKKRSKRYRKKLKLKKRKTLLKSHNNLFTSECETDIYSSSDEEIKSVLFSWII